MRHRAIELVGRIGKQFYAVDDEFGRDRIERNAGSRQLFQHARGILDILFQAVAHLAVIAEGIQRCRRHGVDGVGADQLLDIENVGIVLVLGAGGGPQQPLRLGALGGELLPARSRKQPLVVLVGHLGIGDRDLALQRGEAFLLAGVIGFRDLVVELLVDGTVDAADEEARHARDMRGIAALGGVFFQACDVSLRHSAIDRLREQERDVDGNALGGQRLDGRQAFGRGRHLYHQVLAAPLVSLARYGDTSRLTKPSPPLVAS